MVSISFCTNGATNTSGGICQQPGKAVVIALGALTFVGAGAALGLGKLPRNVALGAMGAGALTGLAAALFWPASKGENRTPSTADLRKLVEGLDGEIDAQLAGQVTDLVVADLKDLRDWNGKEADLGKLIEACPNLKTIDLNGFVEIFGEGNDFDNGGPVIQALAKSSVERIDAHSNGSWEVFVRPTSVKAALAEATDQESYRKRLTAFDGSWAEPQTCERALEMLKEMPNLEHFLGGFLAVNPGGEELLNYLEAHVTPENWRLAGNLADLLCGRIAVGLDGELSELHERYLAGCDSLYLHGWSSWADRKAKVIRLLQLMPNAKTVHLGHMDASWWTDALVAELNNRDKVILPHSYGLNFRADEWDVAQVAAFRFGLYKIEIDKPLAPRLVEQLVELLGDETYEAPGVFVGEGVADVPSDLLKAAAARKLRFNRLPLLDPTDERIADAVGVTSHHGVRLNGNIRVTDAGMKQLVEEIAPPQIWFNPPHWKNVKNWNWGEETWELVEAQYDVRIHYPNGGNEEQLKGLNWARVKQDLGILGGVLQYAGSQGGQDGPSWQIYLQRKSA